MILGPRFRRCSFLAPKPKKEQLTQKPATQAQTINATIEELKQGVPDGESRDKGKALKYAKTKDPLPEHVVFLIDNEAQKATSPRAFKTAAINKLYQREPNGQYTLVYSRTFRKSTDKALPGSILKGHFF